MSLFLVLDAEEDKRNGGQGVLIYLLGTLVTRTEMRRRQPITDRKFGVLCFVATSFCPNHGLPRIGVTNILHSLCQSVSQNLGSSPRGVRLAVGYDAEASLGLVYCVHVDRLLPEGLLKGTYLSFP